MKHEKIVIRYTTSKNERTRLRGTYAAILHPSRLAGASPSLRVVGKAAVRRRPKHSDLLYMMFKDVEIFSEDTQEVTEIKEVFAMADTDIMALREVQDDNRS